MDDHITYSVEQLINYRELAIKAKANLTRACENNDLNIIPENIVILNVFDINAVLLDLIKTDNAEFVAEYINNIDDITLR